MEMTCYDDSQFRASKGNSKVSLKRPATLDLDSPTAASKKQRFTALLTTPDVNKFHMTTPEIERFIAKGNNVATPTPTPTQILSPKNVTEEQKNYVKGFLDALKQLHQTTVEVVDRPMLRRSTNSETNSPSVSNIYSGLLPIYLTTTTSSSTPSATSVIKSLGSPKGGVLTTLNPSTVRPPSVDSTNSSSCCNDSNSLPVPLEFAIKEELQTVPNDFSNPPMSPLCKTPIDMADQERIKLERKRYRNRIAASKCRQRKLENIAQLEAKVKELKCENSKLESVADNLREQVCHLKETVLDHLKRGCKIMIHHPL